MKVEQSDLISRYLDDGLSPDEHRLLEELLRHSPDCAREFARLALMHDRLHAELIATSLGVESLSGHSPLIAARTEAGASVEMSADAPIESMAGRSFSEISFSSRRTTRVLAFVSAMAATSLVVVAIWFGSGGASLSAAAELDRLIASQHSGIDRTYAIVVEETAVPRSKKEMRVDEGRVEEGRPPKPPIDGSLLHVRKGNQFVLIRQTPDGQPFITGCDETTSWAVRPDGPVRVSQDRTRFNRDLPGHEHGIPLFEIEQGLEQVRYAYEIQLLPEPSDEDLNAFALRTRVLVATKKRGHRGPQRVEITYEVGTGMIRQMRFVEMPYGPERLTLRLTLAEERSLGADFFRHQSHHDPERVVEEE